MKKRIKIRKGIKRVFKPEWIDYYWEAMVKILIGIITCIVLITIMCWG